MDHTLVARMLRGTLAGYGLAVVGVLGLNLAVTLFYVVPMFGEAFADFEAELPACTIAVISLSRLVRTHGLIVAVVGAAAAAGLATPFVMCPKRRKLLVLVYLGAAFVLFMLATAGVLMGLVSPFLRCY